MTLEQGIETFISDALLDLIIGNKGEE